nr:hypothetical protein [Caldimonas sp.]
EMLGPDHHQRIGSGGLHRLTHAIERRIEGIPDARLGAILAAGDAGRIWPSRACATPSIPPSAPWARRSPRRSPTR